MSNIKTRKTGYQRTFLILKEKTRKTFFVQVTIYNKAKKMGLYKY